MQRNRAAVFLLALCVLSGISCGSNWEERPGERFATMRQLAAELRASGLCDELRDLTKPHYNFHFGNCRPSGARKASDGLLIASFDDRPLYEKHRRWDRTGCGGPTLYGPMWSVGPLHEEEIQRVIDAVGGTVVGETERRHC